MSHISHVSFGRGKRGQRGKRKRKRGSPRGMRRAGLGSDIGKRTPEKGTVQSGEERGETTDGSGHYARGGKTGKGARDRKGERRNRERVTGNGNDNSQIKRSSEGGGSRVGTV